MQALLTLMWTAHHVSDFVLSVHLWQCQEVLLRQRCFRWKQQVIWLQRWGNTSNLQSLCETLTSNTSSRPGGAWNADPSETLFHLASACSDFLGVCHLLLIPNAPCWPRGQADAAFPSSWAQISTAGRQTHREQKRPLHSHGQEELWLAWKCCVQQAHHHNLDRQTWRTERPSSTSGCLGPWASFGCLLHLEKHFPPEVLRQSRDWLKWQEISYLLNCFHIFSCVRELPAAAIETTATDNKTLWAI